MINVRDISEQTAGAGDKTAASSIKPAHLGHELEALVGRLKI